jgi:hypothetical protein
MKTFVFAVTNELLGLQHLQEIPQCTMKMAGAYVETNQMANNPMMNQYAYVVSQQQMMNVYEANRIVGSNNSGFVGWVEFLIFRFLSLEIRMIQQELDAPITKQSDRQATATKIPIQKP